MRKSFSSTLGNGVKGGDPGRDPVLEASLQRTTASVALALELRQRGADTKRRSPNARTDPSSVSTPPTPTSSPWPLKVNLLHSSTGSRMGSLDAKEVRRGRTQMTAKITDGDMAAAVLHLARMKLKCGPFLAVESPLRAFSQVRAEEAWRTLLQAVSGGG